MDNFVINEVVKLIGLPGVHKLAIALTQDHNNRVVAKEFGLSLWQVRVCMQFLPCLCNKALLANKKSTRAVILQFKNLERNVA